MLSKTLAPLEDYLRSLPGDWTLNDVLDDLADKGVIVEPNALRIFYKQKGIKYQIKPGGRRRT